MSLPGGVVVKNQPYEFTEHFRDFVFMPKFDEDIDALAVLAEPEGHFSKPALTAT